MFESVRQHQSTALLAQVLTLLLFAQLLLPVQAHSQLVRTDGMTIVMCTLQGPKTVEITLDGVIIEHPAPSAAMQFSDLLKDFTPALGVPPRVHTLLGTLISQSSDLPDIPALSRPAPNTRGPPQA